MNAAEEASGLLGVKAACEALGVARATLYRQRAGERAPRECAKREAQKRALPPQERRDVLETLHSERFVDSAPGQVHAELLDEGKHLCSVRTMYRILAAHGEVRERRSQLQHPRHAVPRLQASAPNEVWTWDITKLVGPQKWAHFHLYVVLDLFSRFVVAWRLERRESSTLARELLVSAFEKQQVVPDQLTVHADRGTSMVSKTVAQLFADLGVTKSHSRPRVSNDNPFSESQFKTLKYRPDFPKRFGSLEDGRVYCRRFFDWYNNRHRHSGIAYLTPYQVHYGFAEQVLAERHRVLLQAYAARPERYVSGPPRRQSLPKTVWINEPLALEVADARTQAVAKLGAGSSVVNSVPPSDGAGEEFSTERRLSPASPRPSAMSAHPQLAELP